jgi:hypothetical protein
MQRGDAAFRGFLRISLKSTDDSSKLTRSTMESLLIGLLRQSPKARGAIARLGQ